jgi:glycerol uptake facilitator-like aquaporin
VYWVAQLVGAILAAYTLKAAVGVVSPEAFAAAQSTGVLTEQFPYYAVAIEALLTFFLLNTILHTDVAGKRGPMTGWAIGTTLAIGILAGGPLTGAAMNPARAFGPAVVAGAAGNGMMYLIYFVGPFLGAAVAVGIYRLLNTPDASPDLESDVDEASDGADDELDEQESV